MNYIRNIGFMLFAAPLFMSLVACSGVEYLETNTSYAPVKIDDSTGKTLQKKNKIPHHLGTIRFSDAEDKNTEGRSFTLRRSKTHYMAETLLVDNSGVTKSSFDRSYFSVGADYKKRRLGLQLRFIY